MIEKVIHLDDSKGERIVAVVPEHVRGPGWSNAVTWVYITDIHGSLRTECIQPEERPNDLRILFDAGAVVTRALVESVASLVRDGVP